MNGPELGLTNETQRKESNEPGKEVCSRDGVNSYIHNTDVRPDATAVQLVIDPIIQKDAPVQIVGIEGNGDNALYTVTIKNATDKYVQDFNVTWTAFRPVNCAASGPAPRIQHMTRWASSAHAIDRGLFTSLVNSLFHSHLGLGGGARVLKPHEQTEIG